MAVTDQPLRRCARTEYSTLRAVLLHCPGPAIHRLHDPARVHHARPIDHDAICREHDAIQAAFAGFGVAVTLIDQSLLDPEGGDCCLNMMYVRDLFVMTPSQAVLARMAHRVRRDEARHAAHALRLLDIPVCEVPDEAATLEGADVLWLSPTSIVVGVGNRTNQAGFRVLEALLRPTGVECHAVEAPNGVDHLLGALNIVDRDLALVRTGRCGTDVRRLLASYGIAVAEIPESPEVGDRHAMNIVSLAPRALLMPAGCPDTRRRIDRHGVTIAAELEASQLTHGGGGLACATGILARD
jgi:N-dimethylarginine dimethylaminohydrolase